MSESGIPINDVEHLRDALGLLGLLLETTHDGVEIAVVGGSALLLNDIVNRVTRDVVVVASVDGQDLRGESPVNDLLERRVQSVALELGLEPGWLNLGPVSLLEAGLPEGFLSRCRVETFGELIVHIADRYDLIHMKLFAATDQGPTSKHTSDLLALEPTAEELDVARQWCRTQDVSAPFASEVDATVAWVKRQTNE